ncbi:MAG: hypothetical protein WCV63_01325 [Negativicutes bacterium]|jgi:hypothetical protein
MKRLSIILITAIFLQLCSTMAFAALAAQGVNSGTVLYLLNNQPKQTISYSVTGCLYTSTGVPEYYDIDGQIGTGKCIGLLSKNANIVGDYKGSDGTIKKSLLTIHFYTAADGYRVKLEGVNSRKEKSFGTLLNAVEQDYLYPYDNTWVWNTNNDRRDISFGPMQMTRSKRVSSLTPQISLDNVLPVSGNKLLANRTPISMIYFPISAEIIGSITCYYYKPDGTVTIVDGPQFFENICNTNNAFITNTEQPMTINK